MSRKATVLKIFNDALTSVLPANVIKNSVSLEEEHLHVLESSYDLKRYNNIYLCGSGKASFAMAKEMENILKEKIVGGSVISPIEDAKLEFADHYVSTHPIPSEKSIEGAKKLLETLEETKKDDLILYCLSGGSSALLEYPIEPITLEDFATTTKILLENGFSISEINSVRKHLSLVKGGKLAKKTEATVVVLVISDVIGDDLESIASAPLYFDSTTFLDVKKITASVWDKLPQSVREVIQSGLDQKIEETPKEIKKNIYHHIISNNQKALENAAKSAEKFGLRSKIIQKSISGDVTIASKEFIKLTSELKSGEVIIAGGECTVEVFGSGVGGRNQHFALLALKELEDLDITLLSAGTDGIDGNSKDAGAIIDSKMKLEVEILNLDIDLYLRNFNSNEFFKKLNALITTGYTGTNVMDIMIAYRG